MSSAEQTQSIKVVPFSGKETDFPFWMMKLEALLSNHGLIETISDTFDAKLPAKENAMLDPTDTAEKAQITAREQNAKACNIIIMSQQSNTVLQWLSLEKTTMWPTGKAYKMVAAMKKRYKVDDDLAELDMHAELDKIKLSKNRDPRKLNDDIGAVTVKYGCTLTDKQLLQVLFKAARANYSDTLTSVKQLYQLGSKRKPTYIEYLDGMYEVWRMNGSKEEKSEKSEPNETVLGATDSFTGKCYNCGKKGHRANECRSKINDGNGKEKGSTNGNGNTQQKSKFKGNCNACGKQGHMARDCWSDPKNADKRPKNWKGGKGSGDAVGASIEVLVPVVTCGQCTDAKLMTREFILTTVEIPKKVITEVPWARYHGLDIADWYTTAPISDAADTIGMSECSKETVRQKDTEGELRWERPQRINLKKVALNNEIRETELSLADIGQQMHFPTSPEILKNKCIWICDTGATNHSTWCADGATAISNKGSMSAGMWGPPAEMKDIDLPGTVCDKFGNELWKMRMPSVSYNKASNYNLCSATRMIRDGWELHSSGETLWLEKEKARLNFDIVVRTNRGLLFCCYIKRDGPREISGAVSEKAKMSANKAHQLLGHGHEGATRSTAAHLGWQLVKGSWQVCQSCAEAKAQQKNVPKESSSEKATEPNGRLFHDLATIKPPKKSDIEVSRPVWQILTDEYTGIKFSAFHSKKSDIIESTPRKIVQLEGIVQKPVKIIRQDNAGENKKMMERAMSAEWHLTIKAEYTAPKTPQQNHAAENAFTVIAARSRAAMNHANLPQEERYTLFEEVANTITKLDWLTVIEINGVKKTRAEHYNNQLPGFAQHLRTIGEAGTVKIGKNGKINDRGVTMMFLGYANNHSGNCYRMYNPFTKKIVETRDIIWLNRMYYTRVDANITGLEPIVVIEIPTTITEETDEEDNYGNEPNKDELDRNGQIGLSESLKEVHWARPIATEVSDDDSKENKERKDNESLEEDSSVMEAREGKKKNESKSIASTTGWTRVTTNTRSGRAIRARTTYEPVTGKTIYADTGEVVTPNIAMACMQNYYACLAEIDHEEMEQNLNVTNCYIEYANIGAGIGGGFEHTSELRPMKYHQAINGPRGKEWKAEIENEHARMVKNDVLNAVPREKLPKGTKTIDSTWACKQKSNGTLRGRLNARGFKQVDGEHYDSASIHAPVTNDITIRVVLTIMVMAGWIANVVDVKGAFLHGKFADGERIYMEVPIGWEKFYPPNVVLELKKTIYGLKQAAMAFWKELLKCMRDMNLKRSTADPCLYYSWTNKGLVLLISWIDDNMIVGNNEVVKATKKELMERFECDDCGDLQEYVGCKITRKPGEVKLTQDVLIQSFADEFDLPHKKVTTPAKSGEILMSCKPGMEITNAKQTYYRSGVGKMIHLSKWTRAEISNAVRETARHMQKASQLHVDAMHRIMQYCRDTPNEGLILKPNATWDGSSDFEFEITGRSDSNYATDPETRRSVSGTRVSLNGAPVSWRSSTQRHVTLSVTEAELSAGVTCAQDMLYVMNLLKSIGLKVKLPMVLEMDNRGALDLAHNWSVGGRTRHLDTRLNFLRELKEDGTLITAWVAGEENNADIHTKNLGNPQFEKHAGVYRGINGPVDA